jgi:bifunctional non-homologous end joining protein LigD
MASERSTAETKPGDIDAPAAGTREAGRRAAAGPSSIPAGGSPPARPLGHAGRITHPDKILYPDVMATKADIFAYYRRIAPFLLPYLRDRPITLERLPDGVGPD